MLHVIHRIQSILLIFFICHVSRAQSCSSLNFQWQADIASTCPFMTVTMKHDVNNLPYLYVANKEAGLKIYDITNPAAPALAATVPITLFDTMHVMNITQAGNYLYLAIGNHFTSPDAGGMAIVDVSAPASPVVTDYYVVPGSGSGAGIVKTEGDFAYLGAMKSGLVILDISDKNNIQFVSQFVPSISFPPIASPNPNLYNARGMEVKNDIVYLCYDGGGIRIINCTNKSAPVETGRWCNPVMYSPFDHPKAYNNCVLDDTLLYVAVDYAGMEVLNIADTANITLLGWWNPYNAPASNWFTSPGHANEMVYEKNCNRIYMSTGKSDMHVIDVSDPTQPDSCNYYGGVANNIGTWGIGMWQNQVYLSYICAVIPFSSNWTGVKILTFNPCTVGAEEQTEQESFRVYPNPFTVAALLETNRPLHNATLYLQNCSGQTVRKQERISGNKIEVTREDLPCGLYFLRVAEDGKLVVTEKVLITD